GRLQHAGYGDVHGAADHAPCVIHHHHGAVIEIADTLVVLLAFFQNHHVHALARQHNGLQRVREVVDVEHFDVMQVSDLVQIEVVGDDLGFPLFGQLQQLQIHFAD